MRVFWRRRSNGRDLGLLLTLTVGVAVAGCTPAEEGDVEVAADTAGSMVMPPPPDPDTVITITMGANDTPEVNMQPLCIEALGGGRQIAWRSDPPRAWAVVFLERSPFAPPGQNAPAQRVIQWEGQGNNSQQVATLKAAGDHLQPEYKYYLFYEDAQGLMRVADPDIAIRDAPTLRARRLTCP